MGTTLTGTTPQDTYDSLIKVTDNGPLSGTAKYLSDGLGNDSKLALATSGVGIGTTSPVTIFTAQDTNANVAVVNVVGTSPNYIFDVRDDGTSVFRVAGTGNVGIGTSSPNFILEMAGTTGIGVRSTGVDGVYTDILSSIYSGNANEQNAIQASVSGVASDSGFRFQVSDGSGLSTQTLGYQLNKDRHIFYTNGSERIRVTTNGLTFNGDTAAANALDDYEEGTWTPVYAGGITGATYSNTVGKYTKIGNAVHWACRIQATAGTAAATALTIGGFPFTNSATVETAGSIAFFTVYTTDSVYMYNTPSTTAIAVFYNLDGTALLGTELTSVTGTIHCSGTYFV